MRINGKFYMLIRKLLRNILNFLNPSEKMDRIIKFSFKNIPTETGFSVFDKNNLKLSHDRTINGSNEEFELIIPDNWENPFLSIAVTKYYIPENYRKIESDETEIIYTGGDYYVDLDREVLKEELNQTSVETLIHSIQASANLNGRQQFYISLLALQSYFEHLVYGMLVISGYISKTRFNGLNNHKNRTAEAFSTANTSFFNENIEICPGKDNLGMDIPMEFRNQVKAIMDEVRTLRNKVVHGWGVKDVSREKLSEIFGRLGETIVIVGDDETFYKQAAFIFVRLYAKTGSFRNQLSILNEKSIVQKERQNRGY